MSQENKEEVIEELSLDEQLVNLLDSNGIKLFSNFGVENELSNDPLKLSTENLNTSFKIEKYAIRNYSIQVALEKAKITLANVEATIADEYRSSKHSNKGKLLEAKEMKDKINLDERYLKQSFKVRKLEALLEASENFLGFIKYRNNQISNQIELIKILNPIY